MRFVAGLCVCQTRAAKRIQWGNDLAARSSGTERGQRRETHENPVDFFTPARTVDMASASKA